MWTLEPWGWKTLSTNHLVRVVLDFLFSQAKHSVIHRTDKVGFAGVGVPLLPRPLVLPPQHDSFYTFYNSQRDTLEYCFTTGLIPPPHFTPELRNDLPKGTHVLPVRTWTRILAGSSSLAHSSASPWYRVAPLMGQLEISIENFKESISPIVHTREMIS